MKTETIKGVEVQPVESDSNSTSSKCWGCIFVCDPVCDGSGLMCYKNQRDDGKDIYYARVEL